MDKDKIIKGFVGINKKQAYIGFAIFCFLVLAAFFIGTINEGQKTQSESIEAFKSNVNTSLMTEINAGRIFITLSESDLTELQLKLLKNAGYVFYADDARYFGLEHTKVFVKNSELAHSVIGKDKLKDLQELKSF